MKNDTEEIDYIETHSTDSSIFKVIPRQVIFPKNELEIMDIVKHAKTNKRHISVRAGGTCMDGGSLNNDIIINLTKHFTDIKINQYSKSIDVDMGVYYRDIEHEASKHGLMFAPYTSSKDVCGIGGMLGNNASGEKSIRFGATIDNVLSAKVFLSDGNLYNFEEITEEQCLKLSEQKSFIGNIHKEMREIYKNYGNDFVKAVGNVNKSASGYKLDKVFDKEKNTWNLAKIFIGAQSTLGIIHSAKLKLVEVPTHTRLIAIPVKSLTLLPKILQKIMQYNPESVETYDVNTYTFAKSFLPEDTLKIQKYFSNGEQLIILAQFDNDDVAHKVFLELKEIEDNSEYIYDEEIKNSLWKVRRSSFGVMRDHVYDKKTKRAVPCIEDIIVPIDKFDVFIPELIDILKNNNIDYGFHGHIADGAIRVIPIIDFENKRKAIDQIIVLCNEVFGLVKELGGNMSADHSDGIIRTPFLKEFYGVELYEGVVVGIKKLFDPDGIFNPGKKVGGDKAGLYEVGLR